MMRADVLLDVLFSATMVGAQALVIGGLGLPFAAVTLFAGLGAYAVAAGTIGGGVHVLAVGLVAVLCLWLFVGLRRPLPSDRYLLVTLAALALVESLTGGLTEYGGQLGATATWSALPTYEAQTFLPLAALGFAAVLSMLFILERTELGLAVELTRISMADPQAGALVPATRVTWLVLGLAMATAVFIGALAALYSGRASPDAFGLPRAISFLIATLLAGRRTWIVAGVAVAFFAFPHVFSSLLGYQLQAMAHLREVLTSVLILVWGERLINRGSTSRAGVAPT